jgi:DNA invertase Pin-like site-specific DNA recombinase
MRTTPNDRATAEREGEMLMARPRGSYAPQKPAQERYAKINHLHKLGVPHAAIAERFGISLKTVSMALSPRQQEWRKQWDRDRYWRRPTPDDPQ